MIDAAQARQLANESDLIITLQLIKNAALTGKYSTSIALASEKNRPFIVAELFRLGFIVTDSYETGIHGTKFPRLLVTWN